MKVGFFVNDITPELGIYLTGYGHPDRLGAGVHSPLRATAMVLADGDVMAAVVSLDWCFITEDLAGIVRTAIQEATGIPAAHVLVCCTHTHSAPNTSTLRTLGRTNVDPERRGEAYARRCVPVITETVRQAQCSLREAVAGFGAAKTLTGVSRRGTDENGSVTRFIADPYQMYDDNLTAIRFSDRKSGADIGIVIHLGCHNTAMGLSKLISSDWCGVMRERVADRYHVPVMFLNGAFGDIGPRTNRFLGGADPQGFSAGAGDGERAAAEVGLRAATDALRALDGIRGCRADLPLRIHVNELRLPQALPFDAAEALARVRRFEAEGVAETNGDLMVARRVLEHWHLPPEPELILEQTLVAFGPVALAPFPFEMFSVFSLRLRKYGPFAYNLLCGNTNGRYAYMPDRGAIASGGYEPEYRARVRAYVTLPEAGDLAVSQTLAGLRTLAER